MSFIDGRNIETSDYEFSADVVVVGTGAVGSILVKSLAKKYKDIIKMLMFFQFPFQCHNNGNIGNNNNRTRSCFYG